MNITNIFFGGRVAIDMHMEVPRLGVELELQLPAYITATAMQDPSRICNLHLISLNPLSEARDRTHNPMVTNQIQFH